jgi:hypothetical protein
MQLKVYRQTTASVRAGRVTPLSNTALGMAPPRFCFPCSLRHIAHFVPYCLELGCSPAGATRVLAHIQEECVFKKARSKSIAAVGLLITSALVVVVASHPLRAEESHTTLVVSPGSR